jgi:prepilin-type N-terminal cleavage/methylation domain-containing protein
MSHNLDHATGHRHGRRGPRAWRRHGAAVTLVELLVALAIVAVLSSAVAVMLAGASQTNSYVNKETDAMSSVENATRRILHNVRTASKIDTPTDNALCHSLELHTQNDPANHDAAADVVYSLDTYGNLIETDSRYHGIVATLVTGVSVFNVQRLNTLPTQINITITSGTMPPVTRTITVTCRNQ